MIRTEGAISLPKVEHESDQKYDFRSATSLSPTMKHVLGNLCTGKDSKSDFITSREMKYFFDEARGNFDEINTLIDRRNMIFHRLRRIISRANQNIRSM